MSSVPMTAADANLPLYVKVRRRILKALADQEWPPGAQLPTEAQLATQFDVSIGTIRRAVDDLVAAHVLSRHAGRGTFVRAHSAQHGFNLFMPFVDEQGARVFPETHIVGVKRQRADADLARKLRVDVHTPLMRIDNVRNLQDGRVAMFDWIWVPEARFPDLATGTLASRIARIGSIYGYYQAQHGITIVRIVEDLSVVPVPTEAARHLGVPAGTAVLRVSRLAYSFDEAPVECRQRFLNPKTGLAYRSELGFKSS